MAEYLVIRLPHVAGEPAHWIAVDSDGTRRGPPVAGPLDEAAADTRDRKVIVLVPGADVVTTSVDLPIRAGARLHAALPYALEEAVADDVEQLHFAAGARREQGRTPVAVVSRGLMDDWLARLRDAGIDAAKLVPENHGLSMIPGTISIMLDDGQVFINDGDDTELVMQDLAPGDALVAIGALDEAPSGDEEDDATDAAQHVPRHLLAYCAPADDERYQHDWNALRHELDSVDIKLLPDGTLPRLAATVATGAGINLLQGQYGAKAEYSGLFAPWRHAAMLLLALLVVATGAKAVNVYALSQQETLLREQFQSDYQKIAPGAPAVEDPLRLVASLRSRAGGGSGAPQVLLQALEQLGLATTRNGDARIEAISFRSGVVDVRLTAPSVSVLDSIRRTVDESGNFQARIQSTDQVADRVNSRIQIQARTQ